MNDVNDFLRSSKSTIKQARRDRLSSPFTRSVKPLLTIVVLLGLCVGMIIAIKNINQPNPKTVSTEVLNIAYDEANNDWGFFLPKIGHLYQISSDQIALWTKFVTDPVTHDRLISQISETKRGSLTDSEIDTRLQASTQNGLLDLTHN